MVSAATARRTRRDPPPSRPWRALTTSEGGAPVPRLIALLSLLLAAGAASAADPWPTRPIRMIVGYGAGGSTDLAARTVSAHVEKTLGQPITIENRVGGNGAVGTAAVARAAPDGYTLAMTSGSILTVLPWTSDLDVNPLTTPFIGSTHESL